MTTVDDFGEFAELAPLLILRDRLRAAALDKGLTWLFPPSTLPGVTSAYGLPVVRVADLDAPLLGISAE